MDYPRFNYSHYQLNHFRDFSAFRLQKPDNFCAMCFTLLYPEEVAHRSFERPPNILNCLRFGFNPQVTFINGRPSLIVCQKHVEENALPLSYPGESISDRMRAQDWNYKERSCLSAIKIMSRLTRKTSSNSTNCGHYQMSGDIWTRLNMEFTQLKYGGSLGIPFIKNIMNEINEEKVLRMFNYLKQNNRLLANLETPDASEHLQRSFIHNLAHYTNEETARLWAHNYAFTIEPVNPTAASHALDDLVFGENTNTNQDIKYGDEPAIMAKIFPYLFTNGKGYFSLSKKPQTSSLQVDEEPLGGFAQANKCGETLGSFTKSRILIADRRFGSCIEFLFFCMDQIEKKNIHSYNRHVTAVDGHSVVNRSMVHDGINYIKERTTYVPHTIRSSYAHKRKHNLNLSCMFENLGPPQLFLTFTCDDFADDYKNLLNNKKPWEDPVLFAKHYKRSFQHLFHKYILRSVSFFFLQFNHPTNLNFRALPGKLVVLKTGHGQWRFKIEEVPTSTSYYGPVFLPKNYLKSTILW